MIWGKTRRTKDNHIYEIRAVAQFGNDPRFEWLLSDWATVNQNKGHMRHTILGELGRIDDEAEREAMALLLCEYRPTTRRAVHILRQFRRGTVAPGGPAQLQDLLMQTILTYQQEHQSLAWEEVRAALYAVLQAIDGQEWRETTTNEAGE